MSHDKIRAAARKRMAETGEPYATARREVIQSHQEAGPGPESAASAGTTWFPIDYSDMGRVSLWTETRHGGGPGRGGVEVDSTAVRVRMADFHLDIPRSSVRSATRSARSVRSVGGPVWLAYPGRRQPRLPDPSYAGPALVVVPEDKSGTALAWSLPLPS